MQYVYWSIVQQLSSQGRTCIVAQRSVLFGPWGFIHDQNYQACSIPDNCIGNWYCFVTVLFLVRNFCSLTRHWVPIGIHGNHRVEHAPGMHHWTASRQPLYYFETMLSDTFHPYKCASNTTVYKQYLFWPWQDCSCTISSPQTIFKFVFYQCSAPVPLKQWLKNELHQEESFCLQVVSLGQVGN